MKLSQVFKKVVEALSDEKAEKIIAEELHYSTVYSREKQENPSLTPQDFITSWISRFEGWY
ncbi:MAG: hypothetical protein SVY15_04125 [Halobacteriota archaeon]|nr:hypothetical protein [Halobacteriota archaeon]